MLREAMKEEQIVVDLGENERSNAVPEDDQRGRSARPLVKR